jgi:hypothetical protein
MVKKKLSVVLCAGVLLTLLSSPAALAALATASVNINGFSSTNTTNWSNPYSYSEAYADDSLGAWASDWDSADPLTTSAAVNIGTASGSALTSPFHVFAGGQANPPAWVWSEAWYSYSYQYQDFQAAANGVVTASFAVDYGLNVQTFAPTEYAYAYTEGWIGLYNYSSGNWWYTYFGSEKYVYDGASYVASVVDLPTSVSAFFDADEWGELYIGAETYVYAYSVPVPAAVLLGFLGLSAAGLGMRRLS